MEYNEQLVKNTSYSTHRRKHVSAKKWLNCRDIKNKILKEVKNRTRQGMML